ncbi:uroporphyrinogen decarboxylase family protein [Tepidibacter aestuarii]|uniref:uroporphyrinogen decarboxylase family protein n=1 Tax=Tepidibacter aestuarii TaxID=2925782 RepID=UPI0020BDB3D7|nr:uroporphyrinogen decarboxylase family protein [Tepidibacter aestuarii]CAH2214567.1 Uroporphyrinogen-III decarboxylase [Tepidibacter aestuarii]
MSKDQLTSSERMHGLINGTYLDRVPFISLATMYAGNLAGLSSEEFFLNPQASFDAQILCAELHGCDGSPGFDLPGWMGWDFGGEISFSSTRKIAIPKFKKRAVENTKDAENLKLPCLNKSYGFKKRLEFYKISRKNNFSVSIPAGSPLEIVGHIIDPSLLIRWYYKKPELVHRLLRLATDHILNIADYYIKEFGVENCSAFSCYPLESNTMVSPKIFKTFSFPYILEIHEQLKQKGVKNFGIHLCGDHKLNLEYFKEISLPERSLISVSEKMDIELVAKTFGDQYIIGGNVPSTLLLSGNQRKVFNASKDIIEKMKYHKGGFILMPSCDLPPETPPLNLYAMLKASREFGSYT